jgi:hypothetical protein
MRTLLDLEAGTDFYSVSAADAAFQPLEATLTDIADGTIAENLVNTANPWADNEVADNITASNYEPVASNDFDPDRIACDSNDDNVLDNECLETTIDGRIINLNKGTSLPVSCTQGDTFQDTDADTGVQFYLCESTDSWAVQGSGSGDITTVGLCDTGACTDDFIDGSDIGDDKIDSEHYVAASIDNEHLADNAADSDEIAAGAIDLAHMSVESVDSDQYVDGSIDVEHLANNAVRTTTASKSGAYTIGTDDGKECYGGVIYVTSGATITACDNLAAGMGFSVVTIGAIAVSLDVQADDLMYLDGTALDDGDKADNTSTTGDIIQCTYYDATGWYCASGSPDGDHWTDGGA